MLKKTIITLTLPLLLVLAISVAMPPWGVSAQPASQTARSAVATAPDAGTFQKMIVESGSVTIDLDLNGLNENGSLVARPITLQFAIGANSFLPILVFNDLLRGAEPGSMTLIPDDVEAHGHSILPAALRVALKQLAVEKLASDQGFDLAVRDSNTGFTFFNIQGHQYDYDAYSQSLTITNGRLLISKEFANALGRPSDAGAVVGKIFVGAAMQPIEIDQVVNGVPRSAVMPAVGTVPGPDVIVGELLDFVQYENGEVNGFVGLALGTDACNKGTVNVGWHALPSNDHPFIPQNLYRMSGGATNNDRFEQIGQSWGKHAFAAASSNTCGFGCNGVGGDELGSGCSDAYGSGLNGWQDGIGSRAWVNPFTGFFPQNPDSNDHTGHVHDVTSHRMLVDVDDLNTSLNPGATYFAEANYIVPHEGTWCQTHPTECNMYNNASYKQFTVVGINQPFSFQSAGPTVREQPAIQAWIGATVNQIQPDPGNDGIWFMGYKVTNPSAGVWHYEYALYNQNLDRAIQSFSVPLGPGVNISNIGFHAPPQHPGFAHDGTQGDAGYSSTPWDVTQDASSITWSTETFATNQNANAIRFATLYNFRFDADQPPQTNNATVGFFKTGSPMNVEIQVPQGGPTPTPTPTPTPCSVSSSACGSTVFTPPTDFTLDVTEPVDPATLDASDFTVNGTPADNVILSNGDTTITFTFITSPATQGLNTMHIAAGAFNCGQGPVVEFTCTFRYQVPRSPPSPRVRPTPHPRP
jgi:hypothetical protein